MKKKILFISLKYYDGNLNNGYSYEYSNFYLNLKKYFKIDHLAIDELIQRQGYSYLNDQIKKKIHKYDILFFFMYKDDICTETLFELKKNKKIKTIAWMSDDHWRYDVYSKNYIGLFDLIVTTCKKSFQKYKKKKQKTFLGHWTTDTFNNKNKNINKNLYDIAFVGKNYGNREKYINFLRKKNLIVRCFGPGWKKSNFFIGDIKKVFQKTLINLNFSDSSTGLSFKNLVKVFFHKKTDCKYYFNNPKNYLLYFKTFCLNSSKQIKGRLFEIISSNSFVLTEYHKDLNSFFKINTEIDFFHDKNELFKKIIYYKQNYNLMNMMKNQAYKKFVMKYKIDILFKKIIRYAYK